KVIQDEPLMVNYKGSDVYKMQQWTQGPVMLQALNILENIDLKSMGFNSAKYIHTLYQVMNLTFADRDFYYGDPYFAPEEPIKGLMSKEYAKARLAQMDPNHNDPATKPGDPYPFQGGVNPFAQQLAAWKVNDFINDSLKSGQQDRPVPKDAPVDSAFRESFYAGTTSIESADEAGWVVSVTPSGGWVPAVIAGHTGI